MHRVRVTDGICEIRKSIKDEKYASKPLPTGSVVVSIRPIHSSIYGRIQDQHQTRTISALIFCFEERIWCLMYKLSTKGAGVPRSSLYLSCSGKSCQQNDPRNGRVGKHAVCLAESHPCSAQVHVMVQFLPSSMVRPSGSIRFLPSQHQNAKGP
jgi:hypothetical protein